MYFMFQTYSNDAKVLFKDLNENRDSCLWNNMVDLITSKSFFN